MRMEYSMTARHLPWRASWIECVCVCVCVCALFRCLRSRLRSSAAFCAQALPGIIAVGVVDGVGVLLAERAKRNAAAQAWCSGDGQKQRRRSWRPFAHLAFGAKLGQKTGTFNSECMVAAGASRTGCCRACPICENTTPVVEALAGSMGRFSGELRPPGRGGCRRDPGEGCRVSGGLRTPTMVGASPLQRPSTGGLLLPPLPAFWGRRCAMASSPALPLKGEALATHGVVSQGGLEARFRLVLVGVGRTSCTVRPAAGLLCTSILTRQAFDFGQPKSRGSCRPMPGSCGGGRRGLRSQCQCLG